MAASQTSSGKLFVAGAVGGVAECIAVQPFDMLKTRFQLSTVPNPSIVSSLRAIVQEAGFFRLYRGILPEAGVCWRLGRRTAHICALVWSTYPFR